MKTFGDLRALADRLLFEEEHHRALHLYCVLVRLRPADLDARLRVADAMLALGDVQGAAVVYTKLAGHAANAGYPLHALVAISVLTTLEPVLGELLDQLAELYGGGSDRLGPTSRVSLPRPEQELPEGLSLGESPPPLEHLLVAAKKLGLDLSGVAHYPTKLPPIPLFSRLPQEAFRRMIRALKLRRFRPRQVVIEEGDPGDSFFLLARGEVVVDRDDKKGGRTHLAHLREGAIFGEMALVSAAPRTATVSTVRDADLLEFDRVALAAAAENLPTLAEVLDAFRRERLLQNLLSTARLFRPLTTKQRQDLVRRFTSHEVEAGTSILRRGELSKGLFVVLSGEVEVRPRGPDGERLPTVKLGPSEVFGEGSLLQDRAEDASVVATQSTALLFLGKEYFRRLLDAVPAIAAYVSDLNVERLMESRRLRPGGDVGDSQEIVIELDDEDAIVPV